MPATAVLYQAKVLYDFEAQGESEITVREGQIVDVLDATDADWMLVALNAHQGFIPVSYAQRIAAKPKPSPALTPRSQ
jgi:SH3 domain